MKTVENMSRRDVLLGAAAVAATLATDSALAATGHEHHMMGNTNDDIIITALDCVKTGLACNDHCITLLKEGDTTIVNCMDILSETLAMCTALSQMASYNSSHLADLAKVCIGVCKDCEKECRKHEKKHAACKACADSCDACIKACKKIVA